MSQNPFSTANSESDSCRVKRNSIIDSISAMELGLEYIEMTLTEHDSSLGRATIKNKSWAETMKKDIRYVNLALEKIKSELKQNP